MDILPYGDHAILINFDQQIDLNTNKKVIDLAKAIELAELKGYQYCIPAYCSLTVIYNPLQASFDILSSEIENLSQESLSNTKSTQRILNIPVCYDTSYGLDLKSFAAEKEKSIEEIIEIHSAQTYHVYMLGFMPGFAYMGKLPISLSAKRLKSPRLKVPKRSVGIAGLQTAIYPIESPGGWQLIGSTPVEVFDPNAESPFLFKAGDKVMFRVISKIDYQKIRTEVEANAFNTNELIHVGE